MHEAELGLIIVDCDNRSVSVFALAIQDEQGLNACYFP